MKIYAILINSENHIQVFISLHVAYNNTDKHNNTIHNTCCRNIIINKMIIRNIPKCIIFAIEKIIVK